MFPFQSAVRRQFTDHPHTTRTLVRPGEVGAHIQVQQDTTLLGDWIERRTGNRTEGASVCTKLGSILRHLFYFLCDSLSSHPVGATLDSLGERAERKEAQNWLLSLHRVNLDVGLPPLTVQQ